VGRGHHVESREAALSGPDPGDDDKEISSEEAGENFGDCLQAYGYLVEWMGRATSGSVLEAQTWIGVPTGDSYALASQYYVDRGTNYYMTVRHLTSGT
jgi:hypothetical protein